MRLEVTEEDIQNGTQLDGSSCALALAFDRAIQPGEGRRVSVGLHRAYVLERDRDYGEVSVCTYQLPPEAATFILAFDKDRSVVPTTFEVKKRLGSAEWCPE